MKKIKSLVTIQFRSFLSIEQLKERNKECFNLDRPIQGLVSEQLLSSEDEKYVRAIFLFESHSLAKRFYHYSLTKLSRCEGLIPSSILVKTHDLLIKKLIYRPRLEVNDNGLLQENHETTPYLP